VMGVISGESSGQGINLRRNIGLDWFINDFLSHFTVLRPLAIALEGLAGTVTRQ
jgi:hypothetical protein